MAATEGESDGSYYSDDAADIKKVDDEYEYYYEDEEEDLLTTLINIDEEYYESNNEEDEIPVSKEAPLTNCINYPDLNQYQLNVTASDAVNSYKNSLEYSANNVENDPYDIGSCVLKINNAPLPIGEDGKCSLKSISTAALINNYLPLTLEEESNIATYLPMPTLAENNPLATNMVYTNVAALPSVLPPTLSKQSRKRKTTTTIPKDLSAKRRKGSKIPLKKIPYTKISHLNQNDEGHIISNAYEITIVCPNNTNTLFVRVTQERVNSNIRSIIIPMKSSKQLASRIRANEYETDDEAENLYDGGE